MCRASAVHDVLLHAGLAAVLCISSVLAVSTYVHDSTQGLGVTPALLCLICV